MDDATRVVVVGYGMAGSRLVEQLRARGASCPVTIFGAEPHVAYNRVLLSNVLAGEAEVADIRLTDPAPGDPNCTVRTGVRVTAIDRDRQEVVADDGSRTGYDVLVLATGSRPVVPDLAGLHGPDGALVPGAAVFRTVADCHDIDARARNARRAVVLGGGLLGLEAARGLIGRGLDVEMLHRSGSLMERQLDPVAGQVLARTFGELGVRVHLSACAEAVRTGVGPDGPQLRAVQLDDGTEIPADLLVISCGVRPEASLARAADLTVNAGVVVDDQLRSIDDPRIFAVGECAEHDGQVYGLVAPAWEQAVTVADVIAGVAPTPRYRGSRVVTRLKAAGVELAAMGRTDLDDDDAEVVRFVDATRGTYKKLVIRDDRLVGAILLGETGTVGTVTQLFDRGTRVPPDRLGLLFAGGPGAPAATPRGDEPVCHCNGVTAAAVEQCCRDGADSVAEVAARTRATTGCGGCRGQIAGIVARLCTPVPTGGGTR